MLNSRKIKEEPVFMRILLAEDEKDLVNALCTILKHSNYSVDAVYNGADAVDYLESGLYDVAIFDIMMPVMDGITALKKVRKSGNNVPIIMLTAKSQIDDKVLGLDSGANDYLTKPFAAKELLARIRAVTRSATSCEMSNNTLTYGNVTLDLTSYKLSAEGGSFKLANKEFQMMEMLMRNSNAIIPQDSFMDKIWGFDSEAESNVVWVNLSYLRKKMKAIKANVNIKATRNVGYSLEIIR